MKVILFKLDNPGNKYEWWVRDVIVKESKDIVQIMGVQAEHTYAEIYHIDADDDPGLVERVKVFLHRAYPTTAKNTIMWLFTVISGMIDESDAS